MFHDYTGNEDSPQVKRCSKCGVDKPFAEYSKHPAGKYGLQPQCKACRKANDDVYRQTDKAKQLKKKRNDRWYWESTGRERSREYHASEEGKAVLRRADEKRKENHPEKIKAKSAVAHAVSRGIIPPVKTRRCVECGEQATDHHHYLGYDREHWLDVVPLCKRCHAATWTTPYE